MEVSVTDAEAQLDDLVQRAQAGEEIVLTHLGRQVVRLVPIGSDGDDETCREAPTA